jgi:hypothetical protein
VREPIQDLFELKLIEKIVLKPEDHLFMIAEMGDCFVSSRKRNLRQRHREKISDETFANSAQFLKRQTAGNRPIVQDVVPIDDLAGEPCMGNRHRLAVGDVEHRGTSSGYYLTAVTIRRCFLLLAIGVLASAHDVITTKVTFDREIIRLFNSHCISCHREGGTAFSLATYHDARPWAKAIGEEVLQRRMPPWGAVKGFGDFRNDKGLTEEQLELIVDWEEGGAPEGEEKNLPGPPRLAPAAGVTRSPKEIAVSGDFKLARAIKLQGLWPGSVPDGASVQVTAEMPDGSIEPLLWLKNYKKAFDHPFLLRRPLELPVGTVIRGVPGDATVALLPWKPGHGKK